MQKILMLGVCVLLLSCQQLKDHAYWMSHTDQLNTAYERCQNTNTAECDTVRLAMRDYEQLSDEQNQHPIEFGKKILQIQQELAALQGKDCEAYQKKQAQLQAYYSAVARMME